jgi:branched-chain amino acid transport system permease protein
MGEHLFAQFLLSGLATGWVYALIALGFCLIHNATGIVNFAQGDFLTLGGMFMVTLFVGLHLPLPLAFLLAVLVVGLVGMAIERFLLRPAVSDDVLILIFITIGASIFIRGVIKLVWGKRPLALPPFSGEEPVRILGAYLQPQSLWIFGVTAVVVGVLFWFFRSTLYGKAMRAVACNPRAALLMGIHVERVRLLAFFLSGALGAIGGVLITPITTVSFDTGVMIGLKGFSAAVLGGYGSVMGAVVGGLLLGVLESLGAGFISSSYKDAIAFMVLLLILFLRPRGILGRGEGERV